MSILTHRPRRLRKNSHIKKLVKENILTIDDLIYPLFISEEVADNEIFNIKSMPGVRRFNLPQLLQEVGECDKLGIKAIALFPVISNTKKSLLAEEAFNDNGLIQETIHQIKLNYPEILIIGDIALDPYTTHGQDGIIDENGYILNDITTEALVKQALSQAKAGVDIVAPSDMMDGRIGAIRDTLEKNGFVNTVILSYAAKYASNYYAPFRDAVGSTTNLGNADKGTYQMDFANGDEALKEVAADIKEGADIVMIKPGVAYLDIVYRVKQKFKIPTFVYQVSGEYAMLKTAAKAGVIDEKKVVLETLIGFKRAGADAILTYYAKDVARWLTT